MTERELFIAALRIADRTERRRFLDEQCASAPELRRHVDALLDEADKQDSFLMLPDTRVSNEVTELLPPRIDGYKLLERIGEGGFGEVFMAEQIDPVRRLVALKVIKPGMDSRQVIARFEAERQALAIMDHPNIAKVFDAGATENSHRPYFVMELVKGLPITKYCDTKRLDSRRRLELFAEVCQAIHHAHTKGVIHRDVKPSNVLVAEYDGHPVPKVIDFGIAKATGQQLTEKTLNTGYGSVIGSMEYMSPEQASFNQLDVDTRSDIYSLGVLLYELLAGTPAHPLDELRRAGMMESLRLIRETDPPRPSVRIQTDSHLPSIAACRNTEPSRLKSLLSGELDWIVMKSIEKDRNRRYESASGFAEDIQRYLSGRTVVAHPPSLLYRTKKYVHRNIRALSAALLIGVLLLGWLASATWNSMRQRRQIELQTAAVDKAIEEASTALGKALGSPVGRESEWLAARAAQNRLQQLLQMGSVHTNTALRGKDFLIQFTNADQDRQLAERIENVLMLSATHNDLASWQKMEEDFRSLFRNQGIDLDTSNPQWVGRTIRTHRAQALLSDALELWVGTRGQMSSMGGPSLTAEIMQPWAEAMYLADPDPVRTGIRKMLYSGKVPSVDDVEAVIAEASLVSLSPRTLSWLASMFVVANAPKRSDDIFYLALKVYPNDFMLNYDFAYNLAGQKRWQEAVRYYMCCIAIRPNVAGVWRGLGNALRETNELTRSKESLLQSIQLMPHHAATRVDLDLTQQKIDEMNSEPKESTR